MRDYTTVLTANYDGQEAQEHQVTIRVYDSLKEIVDACFDGGHATVSMASLTDINLKTHTQVMKAAQEEGYWGWVIRTDSPWLVHCWVDWGRWPADQALKFLIPLLCHEQGHFIPADTEQASEQFALWCEFGAFAALDIGPDIIYDKYAASLAEYDPKAISKGLKGIISQLECGKIDDYDIELLYSVYLELRRRRDGV